MEKRTNSQEFSHSSNVSGPLDPYEIIRATLEHASNFSSVQGTSSCENSVLQNFPSKTAGKSSNPAKSSEYSIGAEFSQAKTRKSSDFAPKTKKPEIGLEKTSPNSANRLDFDAEWRNTMKRCSILSGPIVSDQFDHFDPTSIAPEVFQDVSTFGSSEESVDGFGPSPRKKRGEKSQREILSGDQRKPVNRSKPVQSKSMDSPSKLNRYNPVAKPSDMRRANPMEPSKPIRSDQLNPMRSSEVTAPSNPKRSNRINSGTAIPNPITNPCQSDVTRSLEALLDEPMVKELFESIAKGGMPDSKDRRSQLLQLCRFLLQREKNRLSMSADRASEKHLEKINSIERQCKVEEHKLIQERLRKQIALILQSSSSDSSDQSDQPPKIETGQSSFSRPSTQVEEDRQGFAQEMDQMRKTAPVEKFPTQSLEFAFSNVRSNIDATPPATSILDLFRLLLPKLNTSGVADQPGRIPVPVPTFDWRPPFNQPLGYGAPNVGSAPLFAPPGWIGQCNAGPILPGCKLQAPLPPGFTNQAIPPNFGGPNYGVPSYGVPNFGVPPNLPLPNMQRSSKPHKDHESTVDELTHFLKDAKRQGSPRRRKLDVIYNPEDLDSLIQDSDTPQWSINELERKKCAEMEFGNMFEPQRRSFGFGPRLSVFNRVSPAKNQDEFQSICVDVNESISSEETDTVRVDQIDHFPKRRGGFAKRWSSHGPGAPPLHSPRRKMISYHGVDKNFTTSPPPATNFSKLGGNDLRLRLAAKRDLAPNDLRRKLPSKETSSVEFMDQSAVYDDVVGQGQYRGSSRFGNVHSRLGGRGYRKHAGQRSNRGQAAYDYSMAVTVPNSVLQE